MSWLFVKRLRAFVLLAAFASFFLNVALLMPSIYMMQVFDRVFSSRSVETLVMLGAITLLFLALGYFLDTVRVRTLAWAGRSLEFGQTTHPHSENPSSTKRRTATSR